MLPGSLLSQVGLAQNRITGTIGFTYTVMIAGGTFLLVTGNMETGFAGVILASLAVIGITKGLKTFDPPTEGILMIWNRILTDKKGNTSTVKGTTLLANFWPFLINARPVDMTRKEWKFEMKIQSERVVLPSGQVLPSIPVKGVIEMTAFPLRTKMMDYIASGGLDNIYKDMGKIPYQVVQAAVTEHKLSYMDMAQYSTKLAELVDDHLNGTATSDGCFKEKRYGVETSNVRADFPIPPEIEKTMIESASVIYENDARKEEYKGDIEAITQFKALGLDPEKASNAYSEARLIRDGLVHRVQVEGKGTSIGGAIILRDMQVFPGGNQGGQNQGRGGRRNRRQNRQGQGQQDQDQSQNQT